MARNNQSWETVLVSICIAYTIVGLGVSLVKAIKAAEAGAGLADLLRIFAGN